jgi:hypothetical protein
MYLGNPSLRTRGATLVESAIVLSVTLLVLLGLIVGGLGVSRYQAVADLAREATRWASVHGGQYHQDHANPNAPFQPGSPTDWSAEIYDSQTGLASFPSQAIHSFNVRTFGLDPSHLRYTCNWYNPVYAGNDNFPYSLDSNGNNPVSNYVQVTVSYDWFPEALWGGKITFSSTSQMQIAY